MSARTGPSTISPVMRALSAYIAQAPRRALPAAVQERAKHHLLDTLSAMVGLASPSRLLTSTPSKKSSALPTASETA